jgi:putrescine transport system permease protein
MIAIVTVGVITASLVTKRNATRAEADTRAAERAQA